MKSALGIIISREYLERVKRKSFIITTILMPLLMLAMMVAPALIMALSGPEEQTIAVIDDSGVVAPRLQNEGDITFIPVNTPLTDLKADDNYQAILVIGKDVISEPDGNISLYTHGSPSMVTEQFISGQLSDVIEDQRIRAYEIDNLRQILDEVNVDVQLQTYRLDKEEETATSSILSYLLGTFMMLILYMFIMLYGQMVMTSIIEEKNNRVLELVVSSVKPTDLMMGKILGIGAVAVTQILIWAVLLIGCSIWIMPLLSTSVAQSGTADPAMIQAVAQLADPSFMGQLLIFMVLFLIGGYLFYSSIYAAIGSAVDNIQDASQLTSLAIVPIILALIISMSVVQDPNSALAMWTSYIPFTSPMVMMARVPFGIPVWQSIVSLVILYVSFVGMIWLAAKIYRVGIFMYGKKPTVAELIRWTRYK
ncbi:MAG: ABC transporter permease [Muribaculaceae bacterium]|nr:ABC transporter permease [Muribaculaceae bacterium]